MLESEVLKFHFHVKPNLISKVMGLNPVLVLFHWFLINRTWTKQHFFALAFFIRLTHF